MCVLGIETSRSRFPLSRFSHGRLSSSVRVRFANPSFNSLSPSTTITQSNRRRKPPRIIPSSQPWTSTLSTPAVLSTQPTGLSQSRSPSFPGLSAFSLNFTG
ncbi:hypothetical protein TorRG33x02_173140 [Trema orientale]|uniref:Uncharacterized protein n=1 Tax=Trema orientale TaxID=63057 RepID=A0A2P5EMZ7_TREOI|nr:hypothetical protein TorRG33x02_173140 [Trema orientale]